MKKLIFAVAMLTSSFSTMSYENPHVDAAMSNTMKTACLTIENVSNNSVNRPQGDIIEESGRLMDIYYELYIEPYKEGENKKLKNQFEDLAIMGFGYYYGAKNCEIELK